MSAPAITAATKATGKSRSPFGVVLRAFASARWPESGVAISILARRANLPLPRVCSIWHDRTVDDVTLEEIRALSRGLEVPASILSAVAVHSHGIALSPKLSREVLAYLFDLDLEERPAVSAVRFNGGKR